MSKERIYKAESIAYEILKEGIYSFFEVFPYCDDMPVVGVSIERGDWKHDHARARYLLKKNGFSYVSTQVTEDDGSDVYSAIHFFIIPRD